MLVIVLELICAARPLIGPSDVAPALAIAHIQNIIDALTLHILASKIQLHIPCIPQCGEAISRGVRSDDYLDPLPASCFPS